jgi:hypothetical protein
MKDWEVLLNDNLHLFKGEKRVYVPEDLKIAYQIYNGHYGKTLRDTGCGSCRRSVIAHCTKIAEDWRNSHPTPGL